MKTVENIFSDKATRRYVAFLQSETFLARAREFRESAFAQAAANSSCP